MRKKVLAQPAATPPLVTKQQQQAEQRRALLAAAQALIERANASAEAINVLSANGRISDSFADVLYVGNLQELSDGLVNLLDS